MYIYIENTAEGNAMYRFLVEIPRTDEAFIPPMVNLQVTHNENSDLVSDLHINDYGISEKISFDLHGTITSEVSNEVVTTSARTSTEGPCCDQCWIVRDYKGVLSRINWVTSSTSLSIGGGGYSPYIASAPAGVWLQYARKTGNSQILSAFGIVRVAGVVWNKQISAMYMNPPTRTHTTSDLYIIGSDPNTFSPFTSRYFYYFPELRGLITNFYNKVWVYQLNSYYTSTNLPYNQHIRRQAFIDSFMSWIYKVQSQNSSLFQYLHNNPNAVEKLFNLFAQHHLNNRDALLLVSSPGARYSSNNDVRFVDWLSRYLLDSDNIDLLKAYVEGEITQSELESAYPDLIIKSNSFKNTKAECVFNKLGGGNEFKKIVREFIPENSPIHLRFDQKSNLTYRGQIVNAITDPGNINNSYYITITMNKERVNSRTPISVARTMLHEAIHAEIFRKIRTRGGLRWDSNTNSWLLNGRRTDFPTLFNYYENYQSPQHNYMADYYRDAIKTGLRDYATNSGINVSDSQLNDLAWVGLTGTQAWNNLSTTERNRIIRSINDYENRTNKNCN